MAVPGASPTNIPAPNGQTLVGPNGQITPAGAAAFAAQAVGGGNPYGAPPAPAEGNAAAGTLADFGYLPQSVGPSSADVAAGERFGAATVAPFSPSVDYANQFQASLGAQRKALDNALATSLAQLGSRRDAAAKVIATIPGEVTTNLNAAEQRGAAVQGNADKAVKTGQAGGAVGGNANAGLYQADLKENAGAGRAVEPLLQLGATANYDLGATGLQQQHMAGVDALEQQQRAFDASMAQQQQQEAFATQQNNQAYLRQLASAPPETFAQRQDLAGIDPNTGVPFSVEARGNSVNPQTGLTAYESAKQQLARDEQANHANYSSYQAWQMADQKGPQLLKVLSDPAAGKDAQKIVQSQFAADADLRNWLKINQPDLYAQFFPTAKK